MNGGWQGRWEKRKKNKSKPKPEPKPKSKCRPTAEWDCSLFSKGDPWEKWKKFFFKTGFQQYFYACLMFGSYFIFFAFLKVGCAWYHFIALVLYWFVIVRFM